MKLNYRYHIIPILSLLSAVSLQATLVTDHVLIFDDNSDGVLTDANTGSPTVENAQKTSPAANFGAGGNGFTLNDGDKLTFTGTVQLSQALGVGDDDRIRFGLFNGSAVSYGSGTGYEGYYAELATDPVSSAQLAYGDGTGTIPFDSAATTDIAGMTTAGSDDGEAVPSDTPIDFVMEITRNGSGFDLFASTEFINGSSQTITSSASASGNTLMSGFTFNTLTFLNAGSLDIATTASYSNLDVTFTAVPEPSSFALIAGCLGMTWVMLRRRHA